MRTTTQLLSILAFVASPVLAQQVLLEVDTGANRVLLLSPDNGAVLNPAFILDANNTATYDFQTPRAAIQVNNEIWVSDQSPNVNAVYRFDLGGNYLSKLGGSAGGLNNVRGMRFIDGTVYVVNAGTSNGAPGIGLVRYDPAGNLLGFIPTTTTVGSTTVGASPWDVVSYNGRLLVSDGTSRGLQQYNLDGSHFGAFTSAAINNIPAELFVRSNGHVLMAANGSTPSGSFGLYELNPAGAVVAKWTGLPGLGVRGVYELANGQYLISEAGGASAVRGLGTIDPNGVQDNSNFSLILGNVNGGWISVATIPEPPAVALMAGGLLAGLVLRRRRRS
jgi:hypothetical protein